MSLKTHLKYEKVKNIGFNLYLLCLEKQKLKLKRSNTQKIKRFIYFTDF